MVSEKGTVGAYSLLAVDADNLDLALVERAEVVSFVFFLRNWLLGQRRARLLHHRITYRYNSSRDHWLGRLLGFLERRS
jgi:hypothetical protein